MFNRLYSVCKVVRSAILVSKRLTSSVGKPITCKAAVAYAPNKPLVVQNITVQAPKSGEGISSYHFLNLINLISRAVFKNILNMKYSSHKSCR